jgi:hypothetical protein
MMSAASVIPGNRDLRIDAFRGLALVMIVINHMPAGLWSLGTLRSWGLSDSAELFVLLAGVAAAFAYGRFFDRGEHGLGIAAVFSRLFTLYRAHLLLFLLVGAICVIGAERFNEPSHLEALGFDTFLQNPSGFLGHVVTLSFLPGYLDILPLYVVLLAALPLWFWLGRVYWALPLAVGLALWLLVQFFPFNLPNTRTAREWTFNPFAWQLLFVIGFTIGRRVSLRQGFGWLAQPNIARVITGLAVLYTLAALAITAPWREIPGYENATLINPAWFGAISKTDLHIARLVDILAKAWLVVVFVRPDAIWLSRGPMRLAGLLGRNSLEVFFAGTLLSTVGGIVIVIHNYHPGVVAAIVWLSIVLMLAIAQTVEWREAGFANLSKARREAQVARNPATTAEIVSVRSPATPYVASKPQMTLSSVNDSSRAVLLALDPKA